MTSILSQDLKIPIWRNSKIRIISTGYWNSAFPLVRYDTGDRALLPPETNESDLVAIAAGERPFLGILGRSDDFLLGYDGARLAGMNHLPRGLSEVLQIQIVQNTIEDVCILARCKGSLRSDDHRILIKNAREILPSYMRIEVRAVDKLLVADNGKTPFIVRPTD